MADVPFCLCLGLTGIFDVPIQLCLAFGIDTQRDVIISL